MQTRGGYCAVGVEYEHMVLGRKLWPFKARELSVGDPADQAP